MVNGHGPEPVNSAEVELKYWLNISSAQSLIKLWQTGQLLRAPHFGGPRAFTNF